MSGQGVRLSKRVMAQRGCSRREAEALIVSGAVQLGGQTLTDPARRVPEDAPIRVASATVSGAITVLVYKPAGLAAREALHQIWPSLGRGPAPPADLQQPLPLPQQAAGLSVWSSERAVLRRLLDRDRPLEAEWLLTLPMALARETIVALQADGVRASLGHERDGIGQWRLVDKQDRGLAMVELLDAGPCRGAWTLRRQRIGRMGLSPLVSGQARTRQDFEKF